MIKLQPFTTLTTWSVARRTYWSWMRQFNRLGMVVTRSCLQLLAHPSLLTLPQYLLAIMRLPQRRVRLWCTVSLNVPLAQSLSPTELVHQTFRWWERMGEDLQSRRDSLSLDPVSLHHALALPMRNYNDRSLMSIGNRGRTLIGYRNNWTRGRSGKKLQWIIFSMPWTSECKKPMNAGSKVRLRLIR